MPINFKALPDADPDRLPTAPHSSASKEKLKHGVRLIYLVLGILGFLSLILVSGYLFQDIKLSTLVVTNADKLLGNATESKSVVEFFKEVDSQRRALKDGYFAIAQLVLVGVFLPVLTGLLGNLFGREAPASGKE